MKNKTIFVTFLSGAVFVVGCNKNQSTDQQLNNAKVETEKVAQSMRDYTYAQKDEFVKTMRAQLDALNKDLDNLSAKIDSSNDSVKADAKVKLQALRDQADKLQKKLDDVQSSNESNWNDVKAGFNKAMDDVKNSFQQARTWLSDKIAP
jgi:DNA anti-recombination protein RmuC